MSLSAFAQIISRPPPVFNQHIVNEVRKTMTEYPRYANATDRNPTGPLVLDEDSWKTYKNMLARIAKERKNAKAKPVTNTPKKNIRDHRDETFDPIEYSVSQPIIRICVDTFSIVKFKNFDDAVGDGYKNVVANEISKTLRGDLPSYGGYYYIPVLR